MSLKTVATETVAFLENGRYVSDAGDTVQFLPEQQTAVAGTRLYTPAELHALLANQPVARERSRLQPQVWLWKLPVAGDGRGGWSDGSRRDE